MGKYFDMLMEDVRMREGLHSCMNCGVCTGVCPAAEFYNYDPRQIVNIVQTQDDDAIEELMRSDVIWYCGECMSCRPRCPRGNTPAYVIQALRTLSQKLGFFVESEKGRQQLALKRTIGENILRTGYCVTPKLVKPELHPEQGTVWEWIYENDEEIYGQFSAAYNRPGAGRCASWTTGPWRSSTGYSTSRAARSSSTRSSGIPIARPARWDTTVRTTST